MVHNGTLTGKEWEAEHKSDTAMLVDRLKKHLDRKEFRAKDLFEKDIPEVHNRYTKAIGSDKLVFMNGREQINIYNEDNGIWIDDVWYSNLYSLATPRFRYTSWKRGEWKAKTTDKEPVQIPPAVATKIAAE
jgi:hypothetical protein